MCFPVRELALLRAVGGALAAAARLEAAPGATAGTARQTRALALARTGSGVPNVFRALPLALSPSLGLFVGLGFAANPG